MVKLASLLNLLKPASRSEPTPPIARGPSKDADLDDLVAPGILAWRPYPPRNLPPTRSQLGGLPLLASPSDWPRAKDGTPLHFLARIDGKDLPRERGGLPEEGLLQFFARITEEMLWDDFGGPADFSRVLYSREPGRETPAPADLPPIMDGRQHRWEEDIRLPEEPLTGVYPHWPLAFAPIRTWPDASSWGANKHIEATNLARAAEIERATGLAPFAEETPPWLNNSAKAGAAFALPVSAPGERAFPQVWVFCDRIARYLVRVAADTQRWLAGANPASPQEADDRDTLLTVWKQLEQGARVWVRRAEAAGLDAPVNEAAAGEFAAWLTALATHPHEKVRDRVCDGWNGPMRRGLESAIRYCGGHPAAAALVPRELYRQLGEQHALVRTGARDGKPWIKAARHHQLLGHYQSTQDFQTDDNEVLLLQLISDYGVDFLFCDVGEIHFWIRKDDLAARRFDRVHAHTQGG